MADHPRHEDLAALVFGDLSDDEAGQVAQHVEHCPRCDETVRELETAPNDVIRLLRRPVVEHPFERESHCRRLVEVVEAIGRDPYADAKYDTVLKKLAAMATQPVPAIQERRAEVPDALAAIIERMLAKEPDDRFAAPRELAEALAPLAADADLVALATRYQQARQANAGVVVEPEPTGSTQEHLSASQTETRTTRPQVPPVRRGSPPVRRGAPDPFMSSSW